MLAANEEDSASSAQDEDSTVLDETTLQGAEEAVMRLEIEKELRDQDRMVNAKYSRIKRKRRKEREERQEREKAELSLEQDRLKEENAQLEAALIQANLLVSVYEAGKTSSNEQAQTQSHDRKTRKSKRFKSCQPLQHCDSHTHLAPARSPQVDCLLESDRREMAPRQVPNAATSCVPRYIMGEHVTMNPLDNTPSYLTPPLRHGSRATQGLYPAPSAASYPIVYYTPASHHMPRMRLERSLLQDTYDGYDSNVLCPTDDYFPTMGLSPPIDYIPPLNAEQRLSYPIAYDRSAVGFRLPASLSAVRSATKYPVTIVQGNMIQELRTNHANSYLNRACPPAHFSQEFLQGLNSHARSKKRFFSHGLNSFM